MRHSRGGERTVGLTDQTKEIRITPEQQKRQGINIRQKHNRGNNNSIENK